VLQVENDQVRIAHNGEEPLPPQPTPAWGCAVNAAMVAGHNLLTATPSEPLLQIPTP
jgi:hypothetical protein